MATSSAQAWHEAQSEHMRQLVADAVRKRPQAVHLSAVPEMFNVLAEACEASGYRILSCGLAPSGDMGRHLTWFTVWVRRDGSA